jgi:YesN/AraC family two-component response regulator
VLLVDDNDDVRLLMRALIRRSSTQLKVVGEASDGPEALDLSPRLRPHVVVLDYRMPKMDGLTCAREILTIAPDQKLVLFSAHLNVKTQAKANKLGVPCLSKTLMPELPARLAELADS